MTTGTVSQRNMDIRDHPYVGDAVMGETLCDE